MRPKLSSSSTPAISRPLAWASSGRVRLAPERLAPGNPPVARAVACARGAARRHPAPHSRIRRSARSWPRLAARRRRGFAVDMGPTTTRLTTVCDRGRLGVKRGGHRSAPAGLARPIGRAFRRRLLGSGGDNGRLAVCQHGIADNAGLRAEAAAAASCARAVKSCIARARARPRQLRARRRGRPRAQAAARPSRTDVGPGRPDPSCRSLRRPFMTFRGKKCSRCWRRIQRRRSTSGS